MHAPNLMDSPCVCVMVDHGHSMYYRTGFELNQGCDGDVNLKLKGGTKEGEGAKRDVKEMGACTYYML